MENYRRLQVSGKARSLAVFVYRVTAAFPREEQFGMTMQMRKAANGIGLTIAEGCGRGTTPDLIRFLYMANGSAQELEFAAELSLDLQFASNSDLEAVMAGAVEIQKMLRALIAGLKRRNSTRRPGSSS